MSNRPHPRAGSSASRPSWSSGAQERSPPSRCGSSNCRPTFGSSDSRRWEVLAPASDGRSSKLLVYNDDCCAPLAGSHNTSPFVAKDAACPQILTALRPERADPGFTACASKQCPGKLRPRPRAASPAAAAVVWRTSRGVRASD